MLSVRVVWNVGNTVRFSVTVLSQPLEAVNTSVYVPDKLYVDVPTEYVSLSQMEIVSVVCGVGNTVRFRVTVLSQPLAAVSTSV